MPNNPLQFNKVDRLTTKQIDMNSRRVVNASDAVNPQDYVTLNQLNNKLSGVHGSITTINKIINYPQPPLIPDPYNFSPPNVGAYTWVNQGGALANNTYRTMEFTEITHSNSFNMRLLVRTVPTAPYRFTALIQVIGAGNDTQGGLALRDSASGKIVTWCIDIQGTLSYSLKSDHWNSVTSVASTTFGPGAALGFPAFCGIWLSIHDDGANRNFDIGIGDISHVIWYTVASESNTNFITPNQIGYMLGEDATNSPIEMALRVLHESMSL